jgi:enamine deaminase RidA (YjgF/YER057c/UK114 family)
MRRCSCAIRRSDLWLTAQDQVETSLRRNLRRETTNVFSPIVAIVDVHGIAEDVGYLTQACRVAWERSGLRVPGPMVTARSLQADGAESRLQGLGIQHPAPPTPFGSYVETQQTGNLLFLSGMLPVVDHRPKYVGRIGKELDADAGRDAARVAALNALAAVKRHLGSLDRVSHVVRLGVFMATFGDFFDQPGVADGASDLLRDIFGSEKMAVRSVMGVASLPLGMPIELDFIFEVTD